MKHLFLRAALLATTLLAAAEASAQIPRPYSTIDLGRLAKDITATHGNPNDMRMSIWMPTEYMTIVGSQMKNVDVETVELISSILDQYVMFCVAKNKVVNVGGQTRFESMSEYDIRKIVTLEVGGKTFKPLYDVDLTKDALMVKEIMEPMFKSMMGNFGEGMVILIFQAQEKGKNLINPYKEGNFHLNMGGAKLQYNLPLSALYEDRICPEDNAQFPANYSYCPFHGKELHEPFDVPPPAEGEELPPSIDKQ